MRSDGIWWLTLALAAGCGDGWISQEYGSCLGQRVGHWIIDENMELLSRTAGYSDAMSDIDSLR